MGTKKKMQFESRNASAAEILHLVSPAKNILAPNICMAGSLILFRYFWWFVDSEKPSLDI